MQNPWQNHRLYRLPVSVLCGLALAAAAAGGGACIVSFAGYQLEPGADGGGTGGHASSGSGSMGGSVSAGGGSTGSHTSSGGGTTGGTTSHASSSTGGATTSSGTSCASPCSVDGGTGTCCGATCVDSTSDPHNCGACAHDCQGGACTGSTCQPLELPTSQMPYGIAVDSTNLYWADNGGVAHKVALTGGAPVPLGSVGQATGGVAVLGSTLYVAGYSGIWSMPISGGGTPQEIVAVGTISMGQTVSVAVDTNNVYLNTWAVGQPLGVVLQEVNDGGGPLKQLGSGLSYPSGVFPIPLNVVVSAGVVYWTNPGATDKSGSVMRAPVGGTGTAIATGQAYPWGIAVDANNVYWTNLGTLANSFADGEVVQAPVGGGAATALASGVVEPNVIAVDATDVYFGVENTDTISKVPIGVPSTPKPFVTSPSSSELTSMAIDATCVYWANGALWKLAK